MASEFFSKIKELGFDEFTKGLKPGSYPQTAQSIEWVFAFPQAREAFSWLSSHLSESNTLSTSEVPEESFFLSLSSEELEEASDLLNREEFQEPIEARPSVSSEESYKMISELEEELRSIEEPAYSRLLSDWQSALNQELLEVGSSLKSYLAYLNSESSLLSLEDIQEYSNLDEKFTSQISQYTKTIEDGLQHLDISPHHVCLVSDRAQEYTELCEERSRLLELHSSQLEMEVLADIAFAKYESSMKCFKDLLLRESQDKFLSQSDIDKAVRGFKKELEELRVEFAVEIEKFPGLVKAVGQKYGVLSSFEEFSAFSNKKLDYQSTKMEEVLKFLGKQKKNHLLALASILIEQESVQEKYNKIHELKSFLEDLTSQSDFRLQKYPAVAQKFKMKRSDDRQVVDLRDEFLNTLYEILTKNRKQNLLVSELVEEIKLSQAENCLSTHRNAVVKSLESTSKDFHMYFEAFQNTQACGGNTGVANFSTQLSSNLKQLEEMVNLTVLEKENTNFTVAPSGVSERDFFIEYFLAEDPKFLRDL